MVNLDCLEWLRFAYMDIAAAQELFNARQNPRLRPIEIILYHCQQGAEKALKAYLIQHKTLVRDMQTHKLQVLRQDCAKWDLRFNGPRIINHCALLNPFSVAVRYPKHNLSLDSALASRGLNSAKRIYNFVCERLELDKMHLI
jgi:HEPN domain-containing protein